MREVVWKTKEGDLSPYWLYSLDTGIIVPKEGNANGSLVQCTIYELRDSVKVEMPHTTIYYPKTEFYYQQRVVRDRMIPLS